MGRPPKNFKEAVLEDTSVTEPVIEAKTPEVKQEAKPSPKEESKPIIIQTEIDAYISEAIRAQVNSLTELEARDVKKTDENSHRMTLPEEVSKLFKSRGYAARWINKDKRMIDRAIYVRGWAIVNRILFPELPRRLFTANGTIENGDAILGCMPERQAAILRAEPGIRSNERVQNLPIEKWKDGGEAYYKPSLTEERDGETVSSGIQPDSNTNNE